MISSFWFHHWRIDVEKAYAGNGLVRLGYSRLAAMSQAQYVMAHALECAEVSK